MLAMMKQMISPNLRKWVLPTAAFLSFSAVSTAQPSPKPVTIKLDNPSFEDFPQAEHTPQGWFDCGFAGQTAPDVQPNGSFQVTKPPMHGTSYLGLVTRDNNTWEAVGQRLKTPMQKGTAYTFSLGAARSELYVSRSQATNKDVNYITPVVIRVWGGTSYCSKDEMLSESEPISSGNWQKIAFKLSPKANYSHLMIEAFYKTPTLFPYNGNILIDNASDIVPVKIPDNPPIAVVKPPKVTPKPPKPIPNTGGGTSNEVAVSVEKPVDPKPKITPPVSVESPKKTVNYNGAKLTTGEILRLERIQFKPDSYQLDSSSSADLNGLYRFLNENPGVVVEIGGHTNGLPPDDVCDRLSSERARTVAEFLVGKGIEAGRLQHHGYGKRKPIASNETSAGKKLNQRVEIKILKVG